MGHPAVVTVGVVMAASGATVAAQLRIARAARPLTDRWQQVPVEPRGQARLGISFRPLQAQALGLDPMATLATLLDYPFQLIRLGAYWNRIEDGPGRFDTSGARPAARGGRAGRKADHRLRRTR